VAVSKDGLHYRFVIPGTSCFFEWSRRNSFAFDDRHQTSNFTRACAHQLSSAGQQTTSIAILSAFPDLNPTFRPH